MLGAFGPSSPRNSARAASSTSSAVHAAKQLVAAATAPSTFTAPGPSFNAGAAKGKFVYFIGDENSLPFNAGVNSGFKAAMKAAGVKFVIPDSLGNVSSMAQLINQGVAEHANVIIIPSVSPNDLAVPLAAAKRAHIPIISFFSANASLPTAHDRALGVSAIVSYNFVQGGKEMADYAIADSGAHVNAVGYWDSGAGAALPQVQGIEAEFHRLCPATCKVTFKDIPSFANWNSQLPSLTQATILDRTVNYLLPIYDGMAEYMLPAIHAGNAQNRVKIVTLNADSAQMSEMGRHDVIVADVGTPIVYMGWALADQALRLVTGHAAVADERIPLRLFDNSNLPNLSKPEQDWYGLNFAAAYEKLWQLGS